MPVSMLETAFGAAPGTMDISSAQPGFLAEARRMRDALDVALALLDEMLSSDSACQTALARDVADIFREISEIAALGESATGKAGQK